MVKCIGKGRKYGVKNLDEGEGKGFDALINQD